jgi:DNA-binding transcriptional MocR family regulator
MQNWLNVINRGDGAKYIAIADALAAAIESGELRPGERLPAQRALARQLGVDLTTVTKAYGLARRSGLIEGAGKLGSFVRNDIAAPRFGETASEMGMNVPPQPGFNLLPEAIRTGTAALLRAGRHSPILQYQPSLGNIADRVAAAVAFREIGLTAAPEDIAITAGAQHALHAIFAQCLVRGQRLCTAPYVYSGLLSLAKRFGIELVAIEADEQGMLPERLESALRAGASAAYLTPTNDNPTTATMGAGRRREISSVLVRHGATLIEDDAYGRLCQVQLAPCSSMMPDLSWYIAGTSKVISPMLRVAHVRGPSAAAVANIAADIGLTAVMAPPLNAALVTRWLHDGAFDDLVHGVRREAMARQRLVAYHLSDHHYRAHPEGYHIWLDVGERHEVSQLVQELLERGLSAVEGRAFAARPVSAEGQLRISVGGAIDHPRLEAALAFLRKRLDGPLRR